MATKQEGGKAHKYHFFFREIKAARSAKKRKKIIPNKYTQKFNACSSITTSNPYSFIFATDRNYYKKFIKSS